MSLTLLIPVFVTALAVLALLADLAPASGDRRGVGAMVAFGLTAILVATWWVPEGTALGGRWVNDAFTLYSQRILLAAGALTAIGSIDHADRVFASRQGEYYVLLLSSLVGMVLLPGARDLVLVAVAFETMGVPLYVLAAYHKDQRLGIEGASKLFLTGAVSAAVTMYGLSFLIGLAGGTTYADLAGTPSTPLLVMGAVLVLAGMFYKLGAVPFHFWVPDTYQAAPGPFVAFLSVAPKAAGFVALARLLNEALPHVSFGLPALLVLVCVACLLVGNLLAIPQSNVRRLLAFSGIAHIGLLMLALSLGKPAGVGIILFYLVTYVASNMGAFLVVEAVGSQLGDEIPAWAGLSRRNPGLALALLLSLLSLGGIPFVAGFWGKILLFVVAWEAGATWLVLLGALLAVLALFYYLRIARSVYVEPPASSTPIAVGGPTRLAIILAMIGVVGIGLFPRPFVNAAQEAGAAVFPTAVAHTAQP